MSVSNMYPIVKPSSEMIEAAAKLNEGPIMIVYRDYNTIRMETEKGEDTFVWRGGKWKRMGETTF